MGHDDEIGDVMAHEDLRADGMAGEADAEVDAALARERLARAGRGRLDPDSGRRTHGLATAGFGVVFALLWVLQLGTEDGPGWAGPLIAVGYAVLATGLVVLQSRGETVPRHARALALTGLAGTVPLMLTTQMFFNVFEETPVAMLVLGAISIAFPMAVAGGFIAAGARR